eukprot:UN27900
MQLWSGGLDEVRKTFQKDFNQLTIVYHLKPAIEDEVKRNLLFLTVEGCNIHQPRYKTSPQNIEVRIELRDSKQQPLMKRLQLGKGPMAELQNALQSTVP